MGLDTMDTADTIVDITALVDTMDMDYITDSVDIMDFPSSPHPPPLKNPQLLRPEKNVRLKPKLIPKLGTTPIMVDTMVDYTDTVMDLDMVDTTDILDTLTTADK